MLKHGIFLLALLFSCQLILAQDFKTEESIPLKRPEDGSLKIIQLKNGNTALIHITKKKKDINLTLFNADRKLIKDQILAPDCLKSGDYAGISGILQVGNDLIFFISILIDNERTLYRIIVSSSNGEVKQEDIIGKLNKLKMGIAPTKLAANLPDPSFLICSDPNSSSYGIAIINNYELDKDKRIELIHYGGDHQVLSRAYYNSPSDDFQYMDLIDMVVINTKQIIACAYVYNASNKKLSYLALASLEKNSQSVRLKKLDFTKNIKFKKGILRYNDTNSTVALFGLAYEDENLKEKLYSSHLILIDPNTLSTIFTKDIICPSLEKNFSVSKKITVNYIPKGPLNGMPQAFYVNDDGTYTIIFEEMITFINQGSTQTQTGSIGVTLLDEKLKEINGYLIPKSSTVAGEYSLLKISSNENHTCYLFHENEYKEFSYVNYKNKGYIFLNDRFQNVESVKDGQISVYRDVHDSDIFTFQITTQSIERDYLFKKPVTQNSSAGMFSVFDFNKETGTYATTMLKNENGWKFKVLWITLN